MILADTKERSEMLFRSITQCHLNMPDAIRMATIPNAERRQLTFDHPTGSSKITTLSAGSNMPGIGRAVDNLHMSEIPFWDQAGKVWNGILPAVMNRKEACIIMESTPAEMSEPSSSWYKDMCAEARKGTGRWQFVFAPFYSSLLCERPWNKSWTLEKEELELLERFGPRGGEPESAPKQWQYLTLENLAFRRATLEHDPRIRRNPNLFKVFFPTDPITCWTAVGGAAIPAHALEKHLLRPVVPWRPKDGRYQEYKDPVPGAVYVIGADPAGWSGNDHAAFQVLEVWADRVVQAATYSTNLDDPTTVARRLCDVAESYNDAMVVVENNGVGVGTLEILRLANQSGGTILRDEYGNERRYHVKNLYYHQLAGRADTRPGIPAGVNTNAEGMACLVDMLLDSLIVHDEETLDQLQSYKRDREVVASDRWQIVNPEQVMTGRREKHHWDRVSALIWACYGAKRAPQRYRPKSEAEIEKEYAEAEEKAKVGLTHNQMEALRKEAKRKKRGQTTALKRSDYGGRSKYKRST